jgi:AbiV family abortive infection protein
MVTAQYLLEGSCYALEQCGLLLRDAVRLFRTGSFASSTVIAAFAREELGKSILLRELRDNVLAGDVFTVEDVAKKIRDHIKKQELAVLSITLRSAGDDELAKLLEAQREHRPGTTEYRSAELRLKKLADTRAKQYPKERHEARMDCLYVDQDGSGTGWCRPAEYSQRDATDFLYHAVNDYSGEYDRIELGHNPPDLAEFIQTRKAWADRPKLLAPEWPHNQKL